MKAKFAVEITRGRKVASLTVRSENDLIDTAVTRVVARFKSECAHHGVAVASTSTTEVQLSLFGEYTVTVTAFVAQDRRTAPRKRAGRTRRSRRAA